MGMLEWADSPNEATQTYKEVAVLTGSAMATSAVFGAWGAFAHASSADGKGGLPGVGPVGADALFGGAALVGAILGGDALGSMGQTIALGAAIGGLCSASNGWGSRGGLALHEATKTKGVGSLGEPSNISPEAAEALRAFSGK